MIKVHRLNGKEFVVNSELIVFVEATPDTVITLTTGDKIMVRDSMDDVMTAIGQYKRGLGHFGVTREN
jgi:flagellar protein FlbD